MTSDGGLKIVGEEQRVVFSLGLVGAQGLEMISHLRRLRDWGEGHGDEKNRDDDRHEFVHSNNPPGSARVEVEHTNGKPFDHHENLPILQQRRC